MIWMDKRVIMVVSAVFLTMLFGTIASAAIQTTVIVHGPPFHKQIVRVIDPKTESIVDSVYPPGHYTGISNGSFETTLSKVTFLVIDRYNGESVSMKQDFGEYYTGKTIELWIEGAMAFNNTEDSAGSGNATTANNSVAIGNATTNTTAVSVEAVEEKSAENSTGFMTGLFVSAKEKLDTKYLYYVLMILGIVGALFLVLVYGRKMIRNRNTYVPEPRMRPVSTTARLVDAERRIVEAQQEIDELKKREIKKTERRLDTLRRLDGVQRRIDERSSPAPVQEVNEVQKEVQEDVPREEAKSDFYTRMSEDKKENSWNN